MIKKERSLNSHSQCFKALLTVHETVQQVKDIHDTAPLPCSGKDYLSHDKYTVKIRLHCKIL